MKAEDVSAQILVGGLLLDCDPNNPPIQASGLPKDCRMSNFMEGVILSGAAPFFDGISFHSYDYYYGALGQFGNPNWHSLWSSNGTALIQKTEFLKRLLSRYNLETKYLMSTEVGLLCSVNCGTDFELTKSYELIQTYVQSIRFNLRSNIWYDLWGYWRNSGLLYPNGTPRPAFRAYSIAQAELGTARYQGDVSQPGILVYQFHNGKNKVWVAWSQDGVTRSLPLWYAPQAGYDTQGNPIAVSNPMPVGMAPLFIEFAP
jgi:hypothetical protein